MNNDMNYQPITLNGITYLPMERLIDFEEAEYRQEEARKTGCIPQRISVASEAGLLFGTNYVIIVFLVPVEIVASWKAVSR